MSLLSLKKGKKAYPGKYRLLGVTLFPGEVLKQLILGTISRHLKNVKVMRTDH